MSTPYRKPSAAFIGASWTALFAGALTFCVGLWNATMALSEKGYFFTLLMYGLFSAVSVQKSVRDRLDGIPVTQHLLRPLVGVGHALHPADEHRPLERDHHPR
jgi:uncharacterized membrane protein YiaA